MLRERLLGGGGRVADYLPQIEPAQNGTDARFDLMYRYPAEGFWWIGGFLVSFWYAV
jgi:hypothetical protein